MKSITVFTATYNRSYTIDKLYKSLLKQTYKNFEWIVIDDGSTDETTELFNKYKEENLIDINYIKVCNGGKHRAINRGIQLAKGNLFFIVDSDDYLVENALEEIIKWEKSIPEHSNIAGVVGLKGYSENEQVGTTFKGDNYRDLLIYNREKNNITGDKAEIFYTSILKKYKFPEYENENFVPEAVVWNKIAFDGYQLRYFNKIIYICDYLDDGLTKNIEKKYRENPKGFLDYIKQLLIINKRNLINKIKYVSYYKYIFNNIYDDKTISESLGVSLSFIKFSTLIRKIIKKS